MIEQKNELDSFVYSTEKSMKEYGEKLSQDERLELERTINEAKEALKTDDLAKMAQAKQNLEKISHKLAEIVYKEAAKKGQQPGQDAAAGQPGEPGPDMGGPQSGGDAGQGGADKNKHGDDVIDAEFKENK